MRDDTKEDIERALHAYSRLGIVVAALLFLAGFAERGWHL
jgi:hypothetical protein